MAIAQWIYLHGFASGPSSAKAKYFGDRFLELGQTLDIPDLNQDDFSHLTLSRQLQQVGERLSTQPVGIIGSSLGGLTAAWLAERYPTVQALVLLAPAMGFLDHWLPKLGDETVQQWQTQGYYEVYHYSAQRPLPLHYGFVDDARQYGDDQLGRSLPTLILHGRSDEVIPITASQRYAASRPWVELVELDSDHSLGNVLPDCWQAIASFMALV